MYQEKLFIYNIGGEIYSCHQNKFEKIIQISRRIWELRQSSRVGRQVDFPGQKAEDMTIARKEIDLENKRYHFVLEAEQRLKLLETIKQDSDFLSENNVNDYSLLAGVHFIKDSPENNLTRRIVHGLSANMNANVRSSSYLGLIDFFSGIKPKEGREEYYFGIIDTLTEYTARKKAEYCIKSCKYGDTMSCIPPPAYSKRFQDYMKSIIVIRHNPPSKQYL